MDKGLIGVVGLGNMGGGIARTLCRHKLALAVWDIAPAARAPFEKTEGVSVMSPGEMARVCRVIFFVVPATPQIDSCFVGDEGVLSRARDGLIVYDLTTSEPAATREIASRAAERGIAYLDAGMSGGAAGAEAGTLTLMVGGDRDAFGRTRDLLSRIARNIFYLGPSGAGHTMKLIHNMVLHTIFLATCEGGRMAEAAGLSLRDMIDVFNVSNARSFVSEVRFPNHILSEKWDGRSRVYNLCKDVNMAVALAEGLEVSVPLGSVAARLLEAAVAAGMRETDFTRIYERFSDIAEGFKGQGGKGRGDG